MCFNECGTGISRDLVSWCCVDKRSIETFFHFKAPGGFSGHWLNRSWGRGAWGEQVQSKRGVIPAAICFLFWGLGSLNALWHASWRHTPLASRAVPRHHGTLIQINPRTCAESSVGAAAFCDGGAGRREEGDGELRVCVKGHSPLIYFCCRKERQAWVK